MSAFGLWTWLSIAVLILAAPVVFGWFLRDALDLLRGLGREAEDEEAGEGEGAGSGSRGPGDREP